RAARPSGATAAAIPIPTTAANDRDSDSSTDAGMSATTRRMPFAIALAHCRGRVAAPVIRACVSPPTRRTTQRIDQAQGRMQE
ncbi:hypothetical protein ACRUJY_16330, partial [Burkholderia pseudomallei]